MLKIILSMFVAAFCGASALAQDISARAPTAAEAKPSFSGVYVGAVGGFGRYLWQNKQPGNWRFEKFFARGAVYGGALGYNHQFQNNVVVGIEADLAGTGLEKNNKDSLSGFGTSSVSVDHFSSDVIGTLRLRAGYAIGRFLPFATGGFAYSNSKNGSIDIISFGRAPSVVDYHYRSTESRVGWVIGGGVEVLVTPNILIKSEYLHVDLGTKTYTGRCIYCKLHDSARIGRMGVNYKF